MTDTTTPIGQQLMISNASHEMLEAIPLGEFVTKNLLRALSEHKTTFPPGDCDIQIRYPTDPEPDTLEWIYTATVVPIP
jgi:hypothetical protein